MAKPNIIMIMTDQQRFDALGCVNRAVITPAIDPMAAQGILYDQAVCQCPIGHLATAFAKGPAHGHFRGMEPLGG